MLKITVVSIAAELGVVVGGDALDKIRHLGVRPCRFVVATGNCGDLEGLLLVVDEVDFHSFFGFVKHLRPNGHFICCEDGEGSSLEVGDEEGVKEASACRFIPCEKKEGSSLEMRKEEGVKEASACCFSSCEE